MIYKIVIIENGKEKPVYQWNIPTLFAEYESEEKMTKDYKNFKRHFPNVKYAIKTLDDYTQPRTQKG